MTEMFRNNLTRAILGLALVWAGAHTALAQQDANLSIDQLQEQIAANPDRLDLVLALGNAAVREGKLEIALGSFQKVLTSLEPDSREAGDLYLRIGETYRRKGDAEAAIASLRQASELLPDQPVVLGTLALVLDGAGRKDDAERAYRQTLQLDPDNAIAMNNLAYLLAERGEDLDQALALARRAGELIPEDVDMIDTAGWVQLKRKQTDAAIGLFADAVSRAPENEEYRKHLLLALGAKNDDTAAVGELKSLLVRDIGADEAGKLIDLLKGFRSPVQ